MKTKNSRLEALRMIISSRELGSQEELLNALLNEGFRLTQATLSRDLKQLKVAKAATLRGNYVMLTETGFLSINFSGNMGVIKTKPGYASAIAWNIDSSDIPQIIGSIAGDDTIFIVIREGVSHAEVTKAIGQVMNIER